MSDVLLKPEVSVYGPSEHTTALDRTRPETFQSIIEKLPPYTKVLKMPSPEKANAETVTNEDDYTKLCSHNDISVLGGMYADGVVLNPGEAYAVLSADCPTIIAYGLNRKGKLCASAAHAGRDSLVSTGLLFGTAPLSRRYFGIFYSVIQGLKNMPKENIHIYVCCGIRSGFTHPIPDPIHGKKNRKLIDYCERHEGAVVNEGTGEIDLYQVIRGQAIEFGLNPTLVEFDHRDTGKDPHLASHRQDTGRNLVIVSRP